MYRYYLDDLLLCVAKEKLKFSIHFPNVREEYIEEKKPEVKKPVVKKENENEL